MPLPISRFTAAMAATHGAVSYTHLDVYKRQDVYDAMTADRCYRLGLCPFEVIAQFEQEGLQRYKPRYILTFLEHIAHTLSLIHISSFCCPVNSPNVSAGASTQMSIRSKIGWLILSKYRWIAVCVHPVSYTHLALCRHTARTDVKRLK